jgi:hypothetical protein
MIRTFFAALGVLFSALLIFCASFLGNLVFEQNRRGHAYETLAVEITRELARTWSIDDIKSRYVEEIAGTLPGVAPRFLALKPLGTLRYADHVRHETRWMLASMRDFRSPAAGAELLAELLNKTVTVTFVGKFDNGFADITMVLRSGRGGMRVWYLQIESRSELPGAPRVRPKPISHA